MDGGECRCTALMLLPSASALRQRRQVLQVAQVLLGQLVLKVKQVQVALWVRQEYLVGQVQSARQVHQAPQGWPEQRDLQVLQELREQQVGKEFKVSKDLKVMQECKAKKDYREMLASKVMQVRQVVPA